ncbi:MAG: hypothetical protein RLZZ546_3272, partial [Bacteroidota bacterium]
MTFQEYLQIPQFSMSKPEKEIIMIKMLKDVHQHHYLNCDIYRKVVDTIFQNSMPMDGLKNIPFLPVSIFKSHELRSIPKEEVFKILTSSGTTGQIPSRIYLDKEAASLQQQSLSKIMMHVLGNERLPMMIVDSQSVLKDRNSFSARGAGILGISVFGKKHHYILDENYQLDNTQLDLFLDQFNGQKMLIFGFTFMIWQYLVQSNIDKKIDLSQAILIHSG